jgi:hypothetical protein
MEQRSRVQQISQLNFQRQLDAINRNLFKGYKCMLLLYIVPGLRLLLLLLLLLTHRILQQ